MDGASTVALQMADFVSSFRAAGGKIIENFPSDVIAAILTYFLGWFASIGVSRQRRKDRIAEELIASQRELVGRAYPETRGEHWQQSGAREVWMLDPFVSRIRFLVQSMNEDMQLKLRAQDSLDRYIEAKERFIKRWAQTKNRNVGYHEDYRATYLRLREAVQALGPRHSRKLRGLLPERFMMEMLYSGPGEKPE